MERDLGILIAPSFRPSGEDSGKAAKTPRGAARLTASLWSVRSGAQIVGERGNPCDREGQAE